MPTSTRLTFRIVGNRVLVRYLPPTSSGGVVLPDTLHRVPPVHRGIVISTPDTADFKPGDVVLYNPRNVREAFQRDGEEWHILDPEDIFGVELEPESS